jgi:hypothetical protein
MRLVLIGILLLLIGLWLPVLAHRKSGGKPARIGAVSQPVLAHGDGFAA